MTPELRLLAWSVVLGLVHIIAAAAAATRQRPGGLAWAAGARDEPQPPPSGVAARLTRARDNFLETFPLFAAALLAAHLAGRSGGMTSWGALIYFWARVAYLPLYAAGVPMIRSVVWGAAMVGLVMVLLSLFG
ncbi:MAPEG family protein [Muricoccus pecuniae]|uniref:Putative MAPEG superfamily protein n=1 Tax=Muricoccus pecuniae TaxID=693023 RepID=A0A840YF77_9PROT|nr:MAPEG family protein [Roseomonas pecuniae]MBB5692534.1 putative MAPEG superfamily protein [Roseomonas pecuniae]